MRQSWTSVPAQVVPDTSRYLTPASRNGETPCRTCPWPHSAAGHPYMETIMPFLTRKPRLGALLAVTMGGPWIMSGMSATPAHAQITVFDPSNYAQNILTAARTLQSVNQQIQQLQNEAQMLVNQGKNLARIDFPQLDALRQKLAERKNQTLKFKHLFRTRIASFALKKKTTNTQQ